MSELTAAGDLFLKFRVGEGAFVLSSQAVRVILPAVALRPLENAPAYMVGLLDYQGAAVPVLDLCLYCLGRPAASRYSTRIVLVEYPLADRGALLGVIAEQVTELIQCPADRFAPLQVSLPEACLSGEVTKLGGELVARVRIEQLLSPELRQQLFPAHG